uniref:Uncharacterized protein n=1 Tax=Rhizophora mucronata TaxID=61149 RepID=A0A2P2NQZ1_RHIMU
MYFVNRTRSSLSQLIGLVEVICSPF